MFFSWVESEGLKDIKIHDFKKLLSTLKPNNFKPLMLRDEEIYEADSHPMIKNVEKMLPEESLLESTRYALDQVSDEEFILRLHNDEDYLFSWYVRYSDGSCDIGPICATPKLFLTETFSNYTRVSAGKLSDIKGMKISEIALELGKALDFC